MKKYLIVLISIALCVLSTQSVQAATGYTDTFDSSPWTPPPIYQTSFTTGTAELGLSYVGSNCEFSWESGLIWTLYINSGAASVTITSRDGQPFAFDNIYIKNVADGDITDPTPLTIAGSGADPFSGNISVGYSGTYDPDASGTNVVNSVTISGTDFDFKFDNVATKLDLATVTFTNGANVALNYEQTSPSPPQSNWHFGQFSLAGDATGATLNSVIVTLAGTYDPTDLGSNPFRLYASNTNSFGGAAAIGSVDVADPGSGNDVTFSSLSDVIPSGTRYYWVTADISGTATADDNINGTIDVSGDLSITDGTLGSSNYGKLNAGSDATLPVTLSSFTVQYLNDTPTLCWTTQSENNNAGWNIYRGESEEALSNEEAYLLNLTLGLIPGAGSTSEPTEYSFEDFFPIYQGTTYFYWLESVDYSGESEIYGPISLTIPENEWQNPNSPEIPKPYGLHQNYPNPFNPNTEISFMMK